MDLTDALIPKLYANLSIVLYLPSINVKRYKQNFEVCSVCNIDMTTSLIALFPKRNALLIYQFN